MLGLFHGVTASDFRVDSLVATIINDAKCLTLYFFPESTVYLR